MRDALYVVGGLAIVVFLIVRQLRSERFEQRSLIPSGSASSGGARSSCSNETGS